MIERITKSAAFTPPTSRSFAPPRRPARSPLAMGFLAAPAMDQECTCGGSCSSCQHAHENPPGVDNFDDEGLLPHEDAATIVCDGAGDYTVSMGWAATAPCGIGDCVRGHEESHARDWRKRFPNGCKNADGTPKAAGSQVPVGGPGYADFLRESECRSYTGEIPCGEALLAKSNAACKPRVQSQLDTWKKRKSSYCGGGC